jgi:hypothetical protein
MEGKQPEAEEQIWKVLRLQIQPSDGHASPGVLNIVAPSALAALEQIQSPPMMRMHEFYKQQLIELEHMAPTIKKSIGLTFYKGQFYSCSHDAWSVMNDHCKSNHQNDDHTITIMSLAEIKATNENANLLSFSIASY